MIDCEQLNSNISPDKEEETDEESIEHINSVLQNYIFNDSSDSDENTDQLETKQTDPLVNLTLPYVTFHKLSRPHIYYLLPRRNVYLIDKI